ncbi:patellin-6 [Elaeis guineensis]|uniref:Patellin-6 n=1 Tax=Elaeis guineensis var. tenera TaxID=51953 RepID=A0A6I9S0T0_ELAGV|nr:patellin-6 [Elaeis guineensis]
MSVFERFKHPSANHPASANPTGPAVLTHLPLPRKPCHARLPPPPPTIPRSTGPWLPIHHHRKEAMAMASMPEPKSSDEDLRPCEKKALHEFRARVEEAIVGTQQLVKPSGREKSKSRVACGVEDLREVSLWGIPLLPSHGHEGTDVILLKFLRAREFKVSDAFAMLQKTLRWRREFGADNILEDEDLGLAELDDAAYVNGTDKEGHPVCYNICGAFKDKDLYRKTFGSKQRRDSFLRWRVGFMEKGIQQLSFKPGGAGSLLLQVIDLKDSCGPDMKELRSATKKVVSVLQDNYPEFVVKNIFINVSFGYYVYHALFSNLITPRSKSKFIFARPSKVLETLLKYIAPEEIPVQYGGFKREDDDEFSPENPVSELVIKGGGTATIEIPLVEPGVTVVWDITTVGWEVIYKEEFIPDDEGSYRVLIQKEKKMEESVRNSFYINEPGKVVLTIENRTYKKKRVYHRSKSKPTIPLYNLLNQTEHPIV